MEIIKMNKELKDYDTRALMIATKKLTDLYLAIEALKDDEQDFIKTPAQKAIWESLNILGKAEIENETEKEIER